MNACRTARRAGFTLVEIMVVLAILGLVMGAAVYGFRGLARSELRSDSAKLGGAIRYCFDRAITTGAYYRIVLDLDANRYWAERSDERYYLHNGKEDTPGNGQAFDEQALEKQELEEEKKADELAASQNKLAAALDPPPRPRRARFQTFKDASLPQVQLKRVRLFDVYTPRQPEPYTKGRAYLYFFPDGHTERAVVRLNEGDDWYSLIVHPLTGRVEVRSGKFEIPRDFDEPREVTPQ